MSKVLFIYEKEIATISLTIEMFSRKIVKELGMDVSFKRNSEVKTKDINENDVFYFIRCNDYLSYKIAKKIKKSNGFIIAFCDDDLLNLPKDIPSIPSRRRYLKKIFKLSDVLLSSGRHFLNKYRNLIPNSRDVAINTVIDPSSFKEKKDNDVLKILYAGSVTHLPMFNKLVKPSLIQIIEKYGKEISITFIGVHPELKEYEHLTSITYQASLSLEKYREYVNDNNFDIGLAPLYNDEFSKCKYFNKYLEYTLSGTVGLYSNVEPYVFVIKDGINGYLANDDDWTSKLEHIIKHKDELKMCLNNAREDVKDNFNEKVIFTRLIEDIPELVNCNRPRKAIHLNRLNIIAYYIHSIFDTIFITCCYLFHGGIKGLMRHVKTHIKEKKSIRDGGK